MKLSHLRKIRIVVSILFLLLIAIVFLDITNIVPASFISRVTFLQFIPSTIKFANLLIPTSIGFIIVLVLTLLFGRVYCSSICTLGTMQDISSYTAKKINKKKKFTYTKEYFWATITSNKKLGKIKYPENQKMPHLHKGSTSGRLIGGNLAVFTALLGTPYFPNLTGKILMIEDIGELPYRVDRMLNQLRLSGVFKKVKGIILGRFVDCNEHDLTKKTLTIGEVIADFHCYRNFYRFFNLGKDVEISIFNIVR